VGIINNVIDLEIVIPKLEKLKSFKIILPPQNPDEPIPIVCIHF
jgi:hypothetical protein